MAPKSSNSTDDVTALIVCFFAIMFVIYKKLEPTINKYTIFFQNLDWIMIQANFLFVLLSLFGYGLVTFSSIKYFQKIMSEKREKQIAEEERINGFIETLKNTLKLDFNEFQYSYEIEETLEKANEKLNKIPATIKKEFNSKIVEFLSSAKQILSNKKNQERELSLENKKKEELDKKEKEEFEKQVDKLFEYKNKLNSKEAIPINHNYSDQVISEAEDRMRFFLDKEKVIKSIREEAIEYYKKIKDINSVPGGIGNFQEEIYLGVIEDIKSGKIKLKPKIEYTGKLLEKNFYYAKKIDENTKKKAIAQGFRHVRGVDLNGKLVGGGFYIKKEANSEGDYHFYMKHLFSEINSRMKIEHSINGKRVDIAYVRGGKNTLKIGIEIETGKNKLDQLARKIQWLNKNFNYWVFVCPRKFLPKYSRYVDHQKSFCLTPKKAKEKLRELIATI